jgi:hypothetical protein
VRASMHQIFIMHHSASFNVSDIYHACSVLNINLPAEATTHKCWQEKIENTFRTKWVMGNQAVNVQSIVISPHISSSHPVVHKDLVHCIYLFLVFGHCLWLLSLPSCCSLVCLFLFLVFGYCLCPCPAVHP